MMVSGQQQQRQPAMAGTKPSAAGQPGIYGGGQTPQYAQMVARAGAGQQYMSPQQQQQALVVGGQEPLTTAMLAQAQPQEQKQMLGERIFPMIVRMYNERDAGKITGMLLEMDNSELLMMLENDELLRTKVNEAVQVLQSAVKGEGGM